ncbi:MAG: 4Fe-4S binding protein [Desulfatiglandales bacterium]|nr:4Fe-4S binding protein [Desulfatiglandales bacterium]
MPATVNKSACTGCGVCVTICPSDVFRMDEMMKQAQVTFPNDCTNCRLCERNCSFYAISIATSKKRAVRPFTFTQYLQGLGFEAQE